MDRKPDVALPVIRLPHYVFRDAVLRHVGHYADGAPAFRIIEEDGESTITVSLPGIVPDEGCVLIKDYSENEGMVAALLSAGIIRTTGRVFDAGWARNGVVEAEILA